MLEPRGIGSVVRWPAAFVSVIDVSSATLFGMLCTGGNMRRVSYSTLFSHSYEHLTAKERRRAETHASQ